MKYRKKPVVIEAIQFTKDSPKQLTEISDFMNGHKIVLELDDNYLNPTIIIPTLEGDMKAIIGDFVIKGVNGEFYPCKPDIFHKTYEVVE